MDLREIYSSNDITISFEVFPEENTDNLYTTLDKLTRYNPKLISLTYGAGGKTQKFLPDTLKHLKKYTNVMPHFTCICNSKKFVEKNLTTIKSLGIENILALRGDYPEDKTICHYDFRYANELVRFIKQKSNLHIAVAGYPEGHIESESLDKDLDNLKRKVDAGADVIFTQLFFDNTKFLEYVELVRKKGINIPIIPGIMPILSMKQINKMTNLAKITIPKQLADLLAKYKEKDLKNLGIDYATKQCLDLIKNDVKGLHFFTLNRENSTSQILNNIKEITFTEHYDDYTKTNSNLKTLNIDYYKFTYSDKGKPLLIKSPIDFSISHSGNYVAVILSYNSVGIDIQKKQKISQNLVNFTCNQYDQEFLEDSKNKIDAFFDIWCLKEAYSKMTGNGLITSFKNIKIDYKNKEKSMRFETLNFVKGYKMGMFSKQNCSFLLKKLNLH